MSGLGGGGRRTPEALRSPAFALLWSASTVGAVGGAVSDVAFQVLIVRVVHATPIEIGLLRALGVVPYLLLGLLVGALMDRRRLKPVLVVSSAGRAIVLGAVAVLLLLGAVRIWSIAIVILLVGICTLLTESASQPFLPRVVPRGALVAANARLGQSGSVADTAGPALGGAALSALGPLIVFASDAVLNLVSAVLLARIGVEEAPVPRRGMLSIGRDIREGVRFIYRHRTLASEAVSLHIWFLGNSIAVTVFAVFSLRELRLGALAFGIALAFAGLGGFLGAVFAPRIGERLGVGHAVLLGRVLVVVPWAVLAAVPLATIREPVVVVTVVAGSQLLYGVAMGGEAANEMAYRQAAAPADLQGRMNTTIRTVNRVVLLVGSLLARLLATWAGYRVTIGIGAVVFAVAATLLATSPFRTARHEDVMS